MDNCSSVSAPAILTPYPSPNMATVFQSAPTTPAVFENDTCSAVETFLKQNLVTAPRRRYRRRVFYNQNFRQKKRMEQNSSRNFSGQSQGYSTPGTNQGYVNTFLINPGSPNTNFCPTPITSCENFVN